MTGHLHAQDVLAARLSLADTGDAADLATFLGRLLRYERHAVVRLSVDGSVLGVFGRPPFGVLALRTVRLAAAQRLDRTVPARELLDRFSAGVPDADGIQVPEPVTGPAWTGVLPPRTGWRRLASAPVTDLGRAVSAGVTEFRERSGALAEPDRTRANLDRIADEVWSRPVLAGVPLRAAHAAHSLGFLAGTGDAQVYQASGWLRLDAANGSVALRLAERLSLRVV